MAREFQLPDPGEGIQEAEVVEILVSAGDRVEESDVLLNVETDKAVVEVPAPFTGTVEDLRVEVGDTVQVGETVLTWTPEDGETEEAGEEAEAGAPDEKPEDEGEEEPPEAKEPRTKEDEEEPEEDEEDEEEPEEDEDRRPSPSSDTPVPASPATRRLAREQGVDLAQVEGSGEGGRVTRDDVEAAAGEAEEPGERQEEEEEEAAPAEEKEPKEEEKPEGEAPATEEEGERVPLRSVRRTIARRMAESWRTIPHVTHIDHADITELEAFRQEQAPAVEEEGGKLSLSVFLLKAAVAALKDFPRFNARLDEEKEEIILLERYHLGMAVDTDRGLLVPVIRDVDRKGLTDLSREITELAERARNAKLTRGELRGGTFTLTNPGPMGGDAFTPIINPPQVAILGAARASHRPVATAAPGSRGDGEVRTRLILPLCVAFDHRVNDGADAARFTSRLVEVLEDPDDLIRNL